MVCRKLREGDGERAWRADGVPTAACAAGTGSACS